MKFYQPKTEALLLRLGRTANGGRRLQGEGWQLWAMAKRFGALLFYAAIGLQFLVQAMGFQKSMLATPSWQMLLGGFVSMAAMLILQGRLENLSVRSATSVTLQFLPVRGRDIFRWARSAVLWGSGIHLFWALALAWCLAGFPRDVSSWVSVFAQGLLIWVMVLATAGYVRSPLLQKVRLPTIWLLVMATVLVLGVTLLWEGKRWSALPSWFVQTCNALSWLLPPTWVLGNRLNGVGGLLALIWIPLGVWHWWRWPLAWGTMLDQPRDLLPNEGSDENDEDGNDASQVEVSVEEDNAYLVESKQSISAMLSDPLQVCQSGWIERLAYRLLKPQDRVVAAAVMDTHLSWSSFWFGALKVCLACVIIAFISLKALGVCRVSDIAGMGAYVVSGITLISCIPWSNMVPRATASWPSGMQAIPVSAGLPISARELLRISMRLTLARCLAFLLLAIPVLSILPFCANIDERPFMPVLLAIVIALLLLATRPLFLQYRISHTSIPRRWQALVAYGIVAILNALLLLGWMLSSFFALVGAIGGEVMMAVLFTIPSAICARLILEIYLWRLHHGQTDLTYTVQQD